MQTGMPVPFTTEAVSYGKHQAHSRCRRQRRAAGSWAGEYCERGALKAVTRPPLRISWVAEPRQPLAWIPRKPPLVLADAS